MNPQPLYLKVFHGPNNDYSKGEFNNGYWKFEESGLYMCERCKNVFKNEKEADECCKFEEILR